MDLRSLAAGWSAVEGRADRLVAAGLAVVTRLAAARSWRPCWWAPARTWWAGSRARAAASWWLAAYDGCLERAHARLPRSWPERLTSALLLAVLAAADAEAWRWLPW